jgi:hypothetical protein
VIKPRGDFLLLVIANEPWAKFTFGPRMAHGGARGADWWSGHVQRAKFEIVEEGTHPLTLYFLARRL